MLMRLLQSASTRQKDLSKSPLMGWEKMETTTVGWTQLPPVLQDGLKHSQYMFIGANSFPMDLMVLEPSKKLVLQTPHKEDGDFALRYPSSTLTCDQLEHFLEKADILKALLGEEPFSFSAETRQQNKLVLKDVAPIVPPGRVCGIPRHIHQGQSPTSYITGDHIQLLISLIK